MKALGIAEVNVRGVGIYDGNRGGSGARRKRIVHRNIRVRPAKVGADDRIERHRWRRAQHHLLGISKLRNAARLGLQQLRFLNPRDKSLDVDVQVVLERE